MTVSVQDICDLADLRDMLARMSEGSETTWGPTFYDEIALLNRVIHALQTP